ncbi:hypothetical protein HS088_TW03G01013 [Tripterygium wilfordii]|uniref:Uncharacterized protein n=1 Tax=Tripterygium wilfordii TaxID=458696 RepID=A0A7J7DWX7_TRIWF|nr:uncharacterized protein LOC119991432 [Tripterygium wilfordii]KAF5750674.1 hypothetical protein HS088_TW03G01013 [Tripterygium wilfordii]
MKASLKFREDQKPLFRAKVPLTVLGFPFQSGVVAGDSKELTLNLATFFESGPSMKLSYRPNDTWNPFSLVVKTGTGSFGSPVSSSMLMSAEFSLLGRGNPTFMLHFKPQFGDFSIKKSQSSSVLDKVTGHQNGAVSEVDGSIEVVEKSEVNSGFYGKSITVLQPYTAGALASALSGIEVTARTALPVRSHAVLNFRWGVRFPAEMKSVDPTAGISLKKIPFLVMNKIGIEHVDGKDSKEKSAKVNNDLYLLGVSDIGEACFAVKRQLEILQAENSLLKRAVEDLRQEIGSTKSLSLAGDSNSGKYRETERPGMKGKMDRRFTEKSMEGDGSEKAATNAA